MFFNIGKGATRKLSGRASKEIKEQVSVSKLWHEGNVPRKKAHHS